MKLVSFEMVDSEVLFWCHNFVHSSYLWKRIEVKCWTAKWQLTAGIRNDNITFLGAYIYANNLAGGMKLTSFQRSNFQVFNDIYRFWYSSLVWPECGNLFWNKQECFEEWMDRHKETKIAETKVGIWGFKVRLVWLIYDYFWQNYSLLKVTIRKKLSHSRGILKVNLLCLDFSIMNTCK